ncbi:MAG TPA: SUMF1/EgtB/PvdO family nonheme iron enzyme [Cyclobacteriaceae bacterium]|nr:SUMF1/EgtB/PvdO family nonheme iron enzyme [Cyclobacteriaceae bacterium]
MKQFLFISALLVSTISFSQTRMIIVGDVTDKATSEPLAYATIGVKGRVEQTISNSEGKFQLSVPATYQNDTLIVTYVGYNHFEKAISKLASVEHIALTESPTMLDEVRVVHYQVNLRDIDRGLRVVRDKLYAMESEVTNLEYNTFLNWLEDYNKADLRKKYDFDLSDYSKSEKDFFTRFHHVSPDKRQKRNDTTANFNRYAAVNISHEGALEYCKWLTDRYNESNGKKKFRKVQFRLPTLKEWQIAALGYTKFQSWELHENTIEVIVPLDSATKDWSKGKRKKIQVDDNILYPWFAMYYYRNNPRNQFNCFLGNFRVDAVDVPCVSKYPGFDGWIMIAPVTTYFPNDMGLYDVVGNVAEMIDEKGKACGGSWNDWPDESTIRSVKNYSGPDKTVGFRVFMEVIEP